MQVSTYIIRVSKYQHMISKYSGYPYIGDGDLVLVQLDNLILSMSNMDYVVGISGVCFPSILSYLPTFQPPSGALTPHHGRELFPRAKPAEIQPAGYSGGAQIHG